MQASRPSASSTPAVVLPEANFNTSPTSYSWQPSADRSPLREQHSHYSGSVRTSQWMNNAQLHAPVRVSSFSSSAASPISPVSAASPFVPNRPLLPLGGGPLQLPSTSLCAFQQQQSSSTPGWIGADVRHGSQTSFPPPSLQRPPYVGFLLHLPLSDTYKEARLRTVRKSSALLPPSSSSTISHTSSEQRLRLALPSAVPRRRKLVVHLPLADDEDRRMPLSPTARANVAVRANEYAASFVVLEEDELASRPPHFDESPRSRLPDTLDVYLPGRIAWQDLRQELAESWRAKQPSQYTQREPITGFRRPQQLHSRSRSLYTPSQVLPPRFRRPDAIDSFTQGHRLSRSMTSMELLPSTGVPSGPLRPEAVLAAANGDRPLLSSPVAPTYVESNKSQDGDAEMTESEGAETVAIRGLPSYASGESHGDDPEQETSVGTAQHQSASLNPAAPSFQPIIPVTMEPPYPRVPARVTRRPLPPLPIPPMRPAVASPHLSHDRSSPAPVSIELIHPQPRRPLPASPLEVSEPDDGKMSPYTLSHGLRAPLDDAERSSTSFENPLPEQYAPTRAYKQQRRVPTNRLAAVEADRLVLDPEDARNGVRGPPPSASSPARMGDPRALQHDSNQRRALSTGTESACDSELKYAMRDIEEDTIVSTVSDNLPLRILESLIDDRFRRLAEDLARAVREIAEQHAATTSASEAKLAESIRNAIQPAVGFLEKANSSLATLDLLVHRFTEHSVKPRTMFERPASDSEQQQLRESEVTLVEEDCSPDDVPHTEINFYANAVLDWPVNDEDGWYSSRKALSL